MAHYTLNVLPDPTVAVLNYLKSLTEVTNLVHADHIMTQIPLVPDYPYILVQQAGGKGIWPAIEDVALQIDVVGDTQERNNHIARTVRAAIWAIANDIVSVTSDSVTTSVTLVKGMEETAPAWMPDLVTVPPLSRYTARYAVTLH